MIKKLIVFGVLLLTNFHVQSQNSSKQFSVEFNLFSSDSSKVETINGTIIHISSQEKKALLQPTIRLKRSGNYLVNIQVNGFMQKSIDCYFQKDTLINIYLEEDVFEPTGFILKATSASDKSSFVYSKLNKAEIQNRNFGQDFTYLLANTPSAVVTSDAGSGIGYTGIRIRGSDGTRINVNINGVPINDAESHGVFWVNMPDLASSTSSVQVQRGVGSSTNGVGAFGANINISNMDISDVPFLQISQMFGSFNTQRSTLQFGTGKINAFNFSGRLSKINSDGYIDRGASDLLSFQFNLSYQKKKYSSHIVAFGGKEKTYQSWYGTPESRLRNNNDEMNAYADRNGLSDDERANLLNSGRTYNYYTYDNQTDNYNQNHYQWHHLFAIHPSLKLKSTMFLTTGKGFYEEFKANQRFSSYGVPSYTTSLDTINRTDLVRQRWLDNVFYGNFTTLSYKKKKLDMDMGVLLSRYEGKHFGDVIWADLAQPFGKDYRYYSSQSSKNEFNAFVKASYQLNTKLKLEGELQFRSIQYQSKGKDNNLSVIDFDVNYAFFNPKVGALYQMNRRENLYINYSIGNREPVRSDFIDNTRDDLPKHESLQDLELGYVYKGQKQFFQVNLYNMAYKNQLVLTGELNDVGSSLRRNVDISYRRGIELMFKNELIKNLWLDGNLSLSDNKIKSFKDVYYSYDANFDLDSIHVDEYSNVSIAYSPNVILYVGLTDKHLPNTQISLGYKYIGKQYLDNTENPLNDISSFNNFDLIIQRQLQIKGISMFNIKVMANNLLGARFSNNGYTYKYLYAGEKIEERFYYPQALRNLMFGVDIRF
jgi:iron complex outermembrane recepter protein